MELSTAPYEQALRSFSQRNQPQKRVAAGEQLPWNKQIQALYALGISMEDALIFVNRQQPDFDQFMQWVNQRQRPQDLSDTRDMPDVLTREDLTFWHENGYIVLRQAVPAPECRAAAAAIWEYLHASPDAPNSWYAPHDGKKGLMLQFSDHPALNTIRQSRLIRKAYEQLYGTHHIHKSIDKVSFNPPVGGHYNFAGSPLHWDVSLKLPIPEKFQGMLYLSDCEAHEGAFHCVPGFHHQMESWMHQYPPGTDLRALAPHLLQSTPITGKAGDFIIWHQALPHCATPNHGKTPRLAQYLTYLPDDLQEQEEWV